MEKNFEPKKEAEIYKRWLDNGLFKPKSDKGIKAGECFSIIMPPPNITGQLHIGHALNNTMQDVLTRYNRMQGKNCLWVPGTDHASIATEVKIIEALKKEGLTKEKLGRDEFLKRAWAWNDKFGGRIKTQLKSLGCSCDWDRCAFTMDEPRQKAVLKVFKQLYDEGLIYRGNKIINWCPCCKTALSDAEVDHIDESGFLWHIRYPYADGNGYLVVATTRPETLFGDVCVAVNPEDRRYADKIGKMVILPTVNKEIPVVSDSYVEKDFGTGAVKITPAHDPNDYEVGKRHNLSPICVMNDDGTMNELAGVYNGLTREECRKKLIEDLKKANLIEKIEPYTVSKGHCYRCHTIVEPMISKQWFMDMSEMAKVALKAVDSGELKIIPNRVEKIYRNWLTNIKDWCISRQLWWGHRIPAYYCDDCGNTMVSENNVTKCNKCSSVHVHQEGDVLDTWFSSALWPFSTLGYPEKTKDLENFFPTTTLVTAQDIIFFWVARMVMLSTKIMGKVPFKNVLINGIVRDDEGKKMSKSSNNGVDPIEIIEKYGADSLRFSLLLGNGTCNDFRFSETKILEDRKFINKVWNAGKFLELCISQTEGELSYQKTDLNVFDKWIYSKLDAAINDVNKFMNQLDINMAVARIYNFVWDEFCDNYVELTKPYVYSENKDERRHAVAILKDVYINILKLLHPIIPFITEDIYSNFASGFLMEQSYAISVGKFKQEEKLVDKIISAIKKIREVRLSYNVAPSKKLTLIANANDKPSVTKAELVLSKMVNIDKVSYNKPTEETIDFVTEIGELGLLKSEVIDTEKEKEKLTKELEAVDKEIGVLKQRLDNPNFMAKAPKNLIDELKARFDYLSSNKKAIEAKLK